MSNQGSPLKGFKPIGNRQAHSAPVSSNTPPSAETGSSHPSDTQGSAAHKCAKCNFVMASHMQFCPACGAPVGSVVAPKQAASNISCPNCGAGNSNQARFCGSCGAAIAFSQNPGAASAPAQPDRTVQPPAFYPVPLTPSAHGIQQPAYPPSPSGMRPTLPGSNAQSSPPPAASQKPGAKFPTVPQGAFGSFMKTGTFGPFKIGILIGAICLLVFGGTGLLMISNEIHSSFLGNVGTFMMVAGFGLHILSGFVGLARLFIKGWTLQVLGCILIGGGSPILFPVTFGFLFYVLAEILPARGS